MLVSVCIPTYNQSDFLIDCVESVLNQTLLPNEIIISNDNSSDKTGEILKYYSEKNCIFKIINQNQNLGISKNTDFCLKQANGEFIVRLDSDDVLLPEYIKKLSDLLKTDSKLGVAHCNVDEIDENNKHIRYRLLNRNVKIQAAKETLIQAAMGYKVAANILMFRRAALEKVNFITCKANFAEDYHLFCKIAAAGFGNAFDKSILAKYRVWSDSAGKRNNRKMDELLGLQEVIEEILLPSYISYGFNTNKLIAQKSNLVKNHSRILLDNSFNKSYLSNIEKQLLIMAPSYFSQLFVKLTKYKLTFPYFLLGDLKLKVKDFIKHFLIK